LSGLEIERLQYETGLSVIGDYRTSEHNPKWKCTDSVAAEIGAQLALNKIDYTNRILSELSDLQKLEATCRLYEGKISTLNECPMNDQVHPSAIIVLLPLICHDRYKILANMRECSSTMEEAIGEKCQKYCASRLLKGFDATSPYSCEFASCTANCINAQVRECDNSREVSNLYNELAGWQLLMGMENSFNGDSELTYRYLASADFPKYCHDMITRTLIASSGQSTFEQKKTGNTENESP
uniref:ShKT domain-containing protein n=1 Tax=Dracunculus medinensis TaxID=318479 RepID=A0A0N4UJT5_DRAME